MNVSNLGTTNTSTEIEGAGRGAGAKKGHGKAAGRWLRDGGPEQHKQTNKGTGVAVSSMINLLHGPDATLTAATADTSREMPPFISSCDSPSKPMGSEAAYGPFRFALNVSYLLR